MVEAVLLPVVEQSRGARTSVHDSGPSRGVYFEKRPSTLKPPQDPRNPEGLPLHTMRSAGQSRDGRRDSLRCVRYGGGDEGHTLAYQYL